MLRRMQPDNTLMYVCMLGMGSPRSLGILLNRCKTKCKALWDLVILARTANVADYHKISWKEVRAPPSFLRDYILPFQ